MLEGRIIKGIGGLYFIHTDKGVYQCRARGIFRKNNLKPMIGDFVQIAVLDEGEKTGSLDVILGRRNQLIRPAVANVDLAIIVFAAINPSIHLDLLDRFIILAEDATLDILICINKMDLVLEEDFIWLKQRYEQIGYPVVFVSETNAYNKEQLEHHLTNRVSVFAGPSGVGKSSLVNMIVAHAEMETGEISQKIQRGRHTTRHVELLELAENTYVVDSPGFTSIDITSISAEKLPLYFREFEPYQNQCKYNDCMHLNEPDCAVKAAVGTGISTERYERYMQFMKELSRKNSF